MRTDNGEKTEKGYRMRLQNFIPLVVILLFWILSLMVRFVFQLEGIGLSVFEAINEIVKAVLSIGIAWLILKNVSAPILKKKFPKIEVIVGILCVGAQLALNFAWIGAVLYPLYLLIAVGVPLIFSIRHYSWKDLGLFMKDLGLSIPTIRTTASWVVTLLVLFSFISISAGENRLIFFPILCTLYRFGIFKIFHITWPTAFLNLHIQIIFVASRLRDRGTFFQSFLADET